MRTFAKKIVGSGFVLLASPMILAYYIARILFGSGVFPGFSQALSLFPGKSGSYLRVAFYRYALRRCDADCRIGFGSIFSQADTEIARGVYIGPQCNIGSCSIGEHSLIASGVHIMSGKTQHRFESPDVPIQQQGGKYMKVSIGGDTWVGNGSLVMANIGNGCVIGAGSVVTQDMPDYAIAVGNPAKIVGNRRERTS